MADPARVQRVLSLLSQRLGPRFRSCTFDNHPEWILALVEKLPPGQRNEDGTNWKQHGGIDAIRWNMIFATSPTDEEATHRIYEFIVNKNDTTAHAAQAKPISQSDVSAMVAEQLAILLKQHADKLVQERDRIDLIAKQAANTAVIESVTPTVAPSKPGKAMKVKEGIQARTIKSPNEWIKEREDRNALYAERAKILGIEAPVIRTRDKHLDGRWVRKCDKLWEQHVKNGGAVAAE